MFGPKDDLRHRPEPGGRMRDSLENVRLEYSFEAIHDAFSYHDNPDGLPSWFALNRLEQSGPVNGFLEFGGRRIEWDRRMGHRDHSWGTRDWALPHHWKWVVAYTDSGRAVNGWIWIARGEWGFAGCVVRDGGCRSLLRRSHAGGVVPRRGAPRGRGLTK